MNVNEIKKELAAYGFEFKNFPVNVNVNSPWYHNGRTLNDCYKSCSFRKHSAYDYCLSLCKDVNGENFGIRGYNPMIFSVHFTFEMFGISFYAVITKCHNYAYPIGEKIV